MVTTSRDSLREAELVDERVLALHDDTKGLMQLERHLGQLVVHGIGSIREDLCTSIVREGVLEVVHHRYAHPEPSTGGREETDARADVAQADVAADALLNERDLERHALDVLELALD